MKVIPKRRWIPIITDILEYRAAALNTIPYTRKMIARYGNVCEASFTGVKNYFIHDPEIIKEVLTTQAPKFKRTYLFRAFRKFLGDGLFTSDGDYHKRQRRLIKPAFYPHSIEGYAETMVQCAMDELENWKEGDVININKAMTRITLQVITETLFKTSLSLEVKEAVGVKLATVFEVMNKILQNPLYIYCLEKEIRIPLVKKFLTLKGDLDKIIYGIITGYRKDGEPNRMDLLTMLMEATDEETGARMSDEQIRDEVMTFFIAGHETTTLALTWTWYLLGKHPDVAHVFYDEIEDKIGDRLPNAQDYSQLHHTKNVFKESLRLYPPAWTFAREATEDIVIDDYYFPKGSVLWTITYLVHHDKKYFDNPDEFIPGRWDTQSIKDIPKYAYFPFGGGNRMCIGEGFAWMEGVLVLATIASKYRLSITGNTDIDIDPVFTLKTSGDLFMTVVKKK